MKTDNGTKVSIGQIWKLKTGQIVLIREIDEKWADCNVVDEKTNETEWIFLRDLSELIGN